MRNYKHCIAVLFYASLVFFCLNRNAQADPATATEITYVIDAAGKIKDRFSSSEALIKVSAAYAELGERDKAAYILSKTIPLVQNTKNELCKAVLLSELTEQYLRMNEIEKAMEKAVTIPFPDSRSSALGKICYAYAQQNQYSKALDMAEKMDDPLLKARALYEIMNLVKGRREVIKIHKILREATSAVRMYFYIILKEDVRKPRNNKPSVAALPEKDETFASIAAAYAQAGESEKAVAVIKTIGDSFVRLKALLGIAQNAKETGYLSGEMKEMLNQTLASF
ncbi:MAG: hypothetical protein ACM3IL_04755 [Deltaproteobacteria bacterium]